VRTLREAYEAAGAYVAGDLISKHFKEIQFVQRSLLVIFENLVVVLIETNFINYQCLQMRFAPAAVEQTSNKLASQGEILALGFKLKS
jgi:hypothetical protein